MPKLTTNADPEMWLTLKFPVNQIADVHPACAEVYYTGQVVINYKLGSIMNVELKARPNDPGFRKLMNGNNSLDKLNNINPTS